MVGTTLSHFRILSQIGRGGMGVVYRARDQKLRRDVAIKILPPELVGDPDRRRRFLREARAAAAVNHPNIATIHEIDEADGVVFIAMELVQGRTLRTRLSGNGIPLPEAVEIATGVAQGLAFAHQARIIHRDLKPENIIIGPDGQAKILDFGLAKVIEREKETDRSRLSQTETVTQEMTREGKILGTAAYMSPEQARGDRVDHRSDIFSFGTTLYEMVTGKSPFRRESTLDTLSAITRDRPDPPGRLNKQVPYSLERIVTRCLEKKPENRYQKTEELTSELKKIRGLSTSGFWSILRSSRVVSRRGLLLLTGILVPALAILGTLNRNLITGFFQSPIRSIVVLPLKNLSQDIDTTSYLSSGISETLITKLTKLADLRVTPFMTSQRYAESDQTLSEITRELNVDVVLVGSYRVSGGRIHGSVSLVEAKNGLQFWAEEFDEPQGSILATLGDIAISVTNGLRMRLTGREEQNLAGLPGQSGEAYDLYLRGAEKLRMGTREDNETAISFFQKALEIDSRLEEARIGLGAAFSDRYFYGWAGGSKNLDDAEENFREVLRIDPDSIAARRGLIRVYEEKGQSEECLRLGKEVADLGRDDAEALMARGEAYFFGGLQERAVLFFNKVIELDPANEGAHWFRAVALSWRSSFQEAIDAGEHYFQRFGDDPFIHEYALAFSYQALGDFDAARSHYLKGIRLYGDNPDIYIYVYAGRLFQLMEEPEESKKILQKGIRIAMRLVDAYPDNHRNRTYYACMLGLSGDWVGFIKESNKVLVQDPENGYYLRDLAWVYAAHGDPEKAIELLRLSVKLGEINQVWKSELQNWHLDNLKKHPDFQLFLQEFSVADGRLRELY